MDSGDHRDTPSRELTAEERSLSKGLLEGTVLVPTKTCLKCSSPVLVKDGSLEMEERKNGISGTIVVPEIAICSKKECQYVAVRRIPGLSNWPWRYGRAKVEIVQGKPYLLKELPQQLTENQRSRIRDSLEKNK